MSEPNDKIYDFKSLADCWYHKEHKNNEALIFTLDAVLYCANLACPHQTGKIIDDGTNPMARRCSLGKVSKTLEQIGQETGLLVIPGATINESQ